MPTEAPPILIVEDNQVNAMILSSMLRKCGYEPAVATGGRQGIEMSASLRPRLVLMDLQMPLFDGFMTAAEIRRCATGAPPVMVAVTANAAGDVRRACRDAGFSDVLAKPVIFSELKEVLARHLREP